MFQYRLLVRMVFKFSVLILNSLNNLTNSIINILKYETLTTALQKAERFFTFPDVNNVPYIDSICTVERVSKNVLSKITNIRNQKTIIS